jgi:hypothetical protein
MPRIPVQGRLAHGPRDALAGGGNTAVMASAACVGGRRAPGPAFTASEVGGSARAPSKRPGDDSDLRGLEPETTVYSNRSAVGETVGLDSMIHYIQHRTVTSLLVLFGPS